MKWQNEGPCRQPTGALPIKTNAETKTQRSISVGLLEVEKKASKVWSMVDMCTLPMSLDNAGTNSTTPMCCGGGFLKKLLKKNKNNVDF